MELTSVKSGMVIFSCEARLRNRLFFWLMWHSSVFRPKLCLASPALRYCRVELSYFSIVFRGSLRPRASSVTPMSFLMSRVPRRMFSCGSICPRKALSSSFIESSITAFNIMIMNILSSSMVSVSRKSKRRHVTSVLPYSSDPQDPWMHHPWRWAPTWCRGRRDPSVSFLHTEYRLCQLHFPPTTATNQMDLNNECSSNGLKYEESFHWCCHRLFDFT